MRVLYFAGHWPCSHDYGLAYLYDGLREVLGADNVFDYPLNPTFHLPSIDARDDCNLDSDLCVPPWSGNLDDAVPIDLIVVGTVTSELHRAMMDPRIPRDVPVVAVDMTDQVMDLRPHYERYLAGRELVAYFKRELPIGAKWGKPMPMCYPRSRVPNPFPVKEPVITYHATDHNGGSPGIPRRQIVQELRLTVSAAKLDMMLYPGQAKGTRPSPEEYHAKLARGMVGVSWNGADNYDCNRTWEQFAFKMAQVIERPRIEFPPGTELVDGVHCYFADAPEHVAQLARMLVNCPEHAMQIADAGHRHFLQHHTSEARARYLLKELGVA